MESSTSFNARIKRAHTHRPTNRLIYQWTLHYHQKCYASKYAIYWIERFNRMHDVSVCLVTLFLSSYPPIHLSQLQLMKTHLNIQWAKLFRHLPACISIIMEFSQIFTKQTVATKSICKLQIERQWIVFIKYRKLDIKSKYVLCWFDQTLSKMSNIQK